MGEKLKQLLFQNRRGHKNHVARVQFWAIIVLMIAVVLLLNTVMVVLGERTELEIDLTANALYRLDAETAEMLQTLEKPVDIYVLAVRRNFEGSGYLMQALNTLEQYPRQSANVLLTFVDYAADPTFSSRFPELSMATGNIIVSSEGNTKQLALADLFNFELNPEGTSMNIVSSRTEEAITGAIVGVVSGQAVQTALLVGNGAVASPAFTALLQNNNFQVSEVNLTTADIAPQAELAVLLAPQSDYTENELRKLDAFLYNNGEYGKTLLYSSSSSQTQLPNLETFLREWGVAVEDGAVYETSAERTYQYIPFYPIVDYNDTKYRDMLNDSSSNFLMPNARQMEVVYEFRDINTTEVLLQFGETVVVRPSDAPNDFAAEDATVIGPLPALVLARKSITENGITLAQSNLIVSASTDMLSDDFIQSTSLTNSEYLLNLFNTLLERDSGVTIAPKSLAGRNLAVPSSTASTLGVVLAGVVPVGLLVLGVVVWLRRRYS